MLTPEGCRARRERLVAMLPDAPELLIVSDPQFLSSLANYYASPFVFRSANAGAFLLLEPGGSGTLVVDRNCKTFAAEAHVERIVEGDWYDGRRSAGPRRQRLVEIALEALGDRRHAHVGVEAGSVASGLVDALRARAPSVRITPIDDALHLLKRRKDDDEIALLETSLRGAEAGLGAARQQARAGMTEFELYLLIAAAAQRALGEAAIVYGDFVSGPRCEQVGGPPTDRVIESGDLLLLDFSVVVRGYRADFASTFRCGAPPTAEQERLAAACFEAMEAGEKLLQPGRPAREIDAAVRAAFARRDLEKHFPSHSGHGLGVGHPDPPYIVRQSSDILAERDVVTLEPGLYIPGVAGMRFEHDYLITADGYRQLSKHRLDLHQ